MSKVNNTKLPDTKVEVPKDQNVAQQAASPIATLSSELDPLPSYIASAACAGGAGWAYSRMNNPRAAAIAGGFSLLYFGSARLLAEGRERLGYDLGAATSLALVATAGPAAWATGEAYTTTMATIGGMSSIANLLKSYQLRTGKPHEMEVKSRH